MKEEVLNALTEIKLTVKIMMKSVWSVRELAFVLGVSEDRIRRMAADHAFPSYRQNGMLFFKREEIEKWQTSNRTASNDEVQSKAATYCAMRRLKR